MDLQLFAGAKTEAPTPKRRREARERGQVFQSVELTSALILLMAFAALRLASGGIYAGFPEYLRSLWGGPAPTGDWTVAEVHHMTATALGWGVRLALPVGAAALVAALGGTLAQVGFNFTFRPLTPRLDRLDPTQGFKRIASKRSLVELAKAVLRLSLVGTVTYLTIRGHGDLISDLAGMELTAGLAAMTGLTMEILWRSSVVLLVLAGGDYFYQRWEYDQSLKMSKQEVKEEFKQTEGDPQVRGRIRERQRAMARKRMLADVPKAQVVIVNPTHYAVALRYKLDELDAPQVVASGKGHLALKIKEVAEQHGVPVMEDPPLARTLYTTVKVGQYIPEELYQSVAEVLAFVWKLKGGTL